jgi:hypothetical protein
MLLFLETKKGTILINIYRIGWFGRQSFGFDSPFYVYMLGSQFSRRFLILGILVTYFIHYISPFLNICKEIGTTIYKIFNAKYTTKYS